MSCGENHDIILYPVVAQPDHLLYHEPDSTDGRPTTGPDIPRPPTVASLQAEVALTNKQIEAKIRSTGRSACSTYSRGGGTWNSKNVFETQGLKALWICVKPHGVLSRQQFTAV